MLKLDMIFFNFFFISQLIFYQNLQFTHTHEFLILCIIQAFYFLEFLDFQILCPLSKVQISSMSLEINVIDNLSFLYIHGIFIVSLRFFIIFTF